MPTAIESTAPPIFNIRPIDGASCIILLETELKIPDTEYPTGEEFKFILGESDSQFGDEIEASLVKLLACQSCSIRVKNTLDSAEENELKLTLKSFQNRPVISKLTADQKLDIAKSHKARGVELFKMDRFDYAFRRFSKALKHLILMLPGKELESSLEANMKELQVHCYSNMALCQLKNSCYDFTIENCNKALAIDPRNVKSLYRKAEACYKMGNLTECKVVVIEGLKVDSHSKSLKLLLEKVESVGE